MSKKNSTNLPHKKMPVRSASISRLICCNYDPRFSQQYSMEIDPSKNDRMIQQQPQYVKILNQPSQLYALPSQNTSVQINPLQPTIANIPVATFKTKHKRKGSLQIQSAQQIQQQPQQQNSFVQMQPQLQYNVPSIINVLPQQSYQPIQKQQLGTQQSAINLHEKINSQKTHPIVSQKSQSKVLQQYQPVIRQTSGVMNQKSIKNVKNASMLELPSNKIEKLNQKHRMNSKKSINNETSQQSIQINQLLQKQQTLDQRYQQALQKSQAVTGSNQKQIVPQTIQLIPNRSPDKNQEIHHISPYRTYENQIIQEKKHLEEQLYPQKQSIYREEDSEILKKSITYLENSEMKKKSQINDSGNKYKHQTDHYPSAFHTKDQFLETQKISQYPEDSIAETKQQANNYQINKSNQKQFEEIISKETSPSNLKNFSEYQQQQQNLIQLKQLDQTSDSKQQKEQEYKQICDQSSQPINKFNKDQQKLQQKIQLPYSQIRTNYYGTSRYQSSQNYGLPDNKAQLKNQILQDTLRSKFLEGGSGTKRQESTQRQDIVQQSPEQIYETNILHQDKQQQIKEIQNQEFQNTEDLAPGIQNQEFQPISRQQNQNLDQNMILESSTNREQFGSPLKISELEQQQNASNTFEQYQQKQVYQQKLKNSQIIQKYKLLKQRSSQYLNSNTPKQKKYAPQQKQTLQQIDNNLQQNTLSPQNHIYQTKNINEISLIQSSQQQSHSKPILEGTQIPPQKIRYSPQRIIDNKIITTNSPYRDFGITNVAHIKVADSSILQPVEVKNSTFIKSSVRFSPEKENEIDQDIQQEEQNVVHERKYHIFENGYIYNGEFSNSLKLIRGGFGILKNNKGQIIYNGDWKNDFYDGYGFLNSEKKVQEFDQDPENLIDLTNYWLKYEGLFQNGKMNGKGNLFLSNENKIEGNFLNGYLYGDIIFYSQQGEIYEITLLSDVLVQD